MWHLMASDVILHSCSDNIGYVQNRLTKKVVNTIISQSNIQIV